MIWTCTYLVNKQHARDKFSHALIDIPADDLVDFFPQLVRNLRLLRLHQLSHHAHNVLTALRPRIGNVEIVESHILDDFLLLVHFALGYGDVFLRLQVELGRVRIRPAHPFARARVGFDVYDVAYGHALFLYGFVY